MPNLQENTKKINKLPKSVKNSQWSTFSYNQSQSIPLSRILRKISFALKNNWGNADSTTINS